MTPNATAREQRDAPRVDVPADRLGNVARVLVLGQQARRAALERRVQRRKEERERRLGHPRVGRKRVGERAKALARGELDDEPGEGCRRRVHAAGGNGVPQSDRSARRHRDQGARPNRVRAPRNATPGNAPRGTPVSLLRPYRTIDHGWDTEQYGNRRFAHSLDRSCPGACRPVRVVGGPARSVEAALRLLEPVADDHLDRVGGPRRRARRDRRAARTATGRSRRRHVGSPRSGRPDSDPQTKEVRAAEHLGDRAKSVVPREPSAGASLEPARARGRPRRGRRARLRSGP